jgi:hypothetical protein
MSSKQIQIVLNDHPYCSDIHPEDHEGCHKMHKPENGICYRGHLLCKDTFQCLLGHTGFGFKTNPADIASILTDDIIETLKTTNIDEVRYILKKYSSVLYHKKQELKLILNNNGQFITELKTKISKLEFEIASLKTKNRDLERDNEYLKKTVNSLNISISKMHIQNVMLHKELEKSHIEVVKLTDDNKQINEKYTASLLEIFDLQKKIVDLTYPELLPEMACSSPMTASARPFTPTMTPTIARLQTDEKRSTGASFVLLPQARNLSPK